MFGRVNRIPKRSIAREELVMKKILVVDDEKPISDIVKFSLSKEGFEVVTAFDGEEGLAVFAAENPDLVILDLMLP